MSSHRLNERSDCRNRLTDGPVIIYAVVTQFNVMYNNFNVINAHYMEHYEQSLQTVRQTSRGIDCTQCPVHAARMIQQQWPAGRRPAAGFVLAYHSGGLASRA